VSRWCRQQPAASAAAIRISRSPRNSEPSGRFRYMSIITKPTQQVQSRGELREASSMRVAGPYTAECQSCRRSEVGQRNGLPFEPLPSQQPGAAVSRLRLVRLIFLAAPKAASH